MNYIQSTMNLRSFVHPVASIIIHDAISAININNWTGSQQFNMKD